MNRPTAPISSASPLFQQALQEDSNRLMDWLWYAGQMTSPAEQRYCYERALYINPLDERAARALRNLQTQDQAARAMTTPAAHPLGRLVQALFPRI